MSTWRQEWEAENTFKALGGGVQGKWGGDTREHGEEPQGLEDLSSGWEPRGKVGEQWDGAHGLSGPTGSAIRGMAEVTMRGH